MLKQFEQATEEAIRSLRGAAELRFKEVIEEPSRQVSEEFEGVMQSLEEKRRANLERAAGLREQIAVVQSQLDSVTRYNANIERSHAQLRATTSVANSRSNSDQELLRLKQAVRGLWRGLDSAAHGGRATSVSIDKITFLSQCLKHAAYSPRLYAALLGHARSLQTNSERSLANTKAVNAARNSYRATAARMAKAAATLL